MKTTLKNAGVHVMALLIALFNLTGITDLSAQLCTSPNSIIYGLTADAAIHPVTVATGAAGARLNPVSGLAPYMANAMGYNSLNGRVYYFKRNIQGSPQEFVVYNPLANTVTALANCPSSSIINLGCMNATGAGYYCIDAFGSLFYFRIGTNTWTTISSNVRNQANVTLRSIISTATIPTATDRVYGDISIDGSGNMWILISGPNNFGLYKLPAPLPTTNVIGPLTIMQVLAPTTPSPGLQSIGGVAFTSTGEMYISTNSGDNKLYRMEQNLSLTYLSTMTIDGLGTDLTSCHYPMYVLPDSWKQFTAILKGQENITLTWSIIEQPDTKTYVIEHSVDGLNWEQLSTQQARGRDGTLSDYAYAHNTPVKGKHYYRIARMDLYNTPSYSETRVIYNNGNASFSIWPNPAQDVLQVDANIAVEGWKRTVSISDQTGKLVRKKTLEKGINQIDIRMLVPGHYLITIETTNGEKATHKFLKN